MQQSMTRCKDCNTYMLTTLLEQSHNMCRYCIKRYNETTSKNNKYIPIKDCEPGVYTEWYKATKLQPISDDEIELSQKSVPNSIASTKRKNKRTTSQKKPTMRGKHRNKFKDLYGIRLKDMVKKFASKNKTKDYICYEIYKEYNFLPDKIQVASGFSGNILPYHVDKNESLSDLVYIDTIPNIQDILNKSENKLETYINFIDYLQNNKLFLKGTEQDAYIQHITETQVNNLKQSLCDTVCDTRLRGIDNNNDNYNEMTTKDVVKLIASPDLTSREIHQMVCKQLNRVVSKQYVSRLLHDLKLPYKKVVLWDTTKHSTQMTLNEAVKIAHGGNNNQTMDELYNKVNEIMGKECNKQSVYKSVSYFNLGYIRVKNLSRKVEESKEDKVEHNVEEVLEAIPIQEPKEDKVSVEQEVLTTIQDKAKKLNCNTEKDYSTDTYIEVLEILKYLSTKRTTLQRTRLDQKDITQGYQEDVLHEIEFSESEPGNTYLQDKLKLIRGYRRYFEHDYEDLIIMEDLLSVIDTEKLSEVLTKLKSKRNARAGKYFYIPRVDNSMIQKYEWAKNGQLNSKVVNRPLLTTADRLESRKMHQYIATCQVSGFGIGTFKDWKRVVTASDEKNAEEQVLKVLNNTKNQKCGNYMWHNLNIKLQN